MATETEIETCKSKVTIAIGRHTEADVECGLEEGHEDEEHVNAQDTTAKDSKTGKESKSTIIFTWRDAV